MRRPGFTIIEVLAALALLALLVALMVGSMNTMRLRAEWVGERTARQRDVSVAIDRLATALRTTMVEVPTIGAGIAGDADRVAVLTRTASLGRDAAGDVARFELAADADARTIAARWGPAFGTNGTAEHPIASNARARLRYHDGGAWRDTFDSGSAGQLPRAVELSVWFGVQPTGESDVASAEPAYPEREPDRRRVIAITDADGGA